MCVCVHMGSEGAAGNTCLFLYAFIVLFLCTCQAPLVTSNKFIRAGLNQTVEVREIVIRICR